MVPASLALGSWVHNLPCAPLNSSQEIIFQSPAWLYLLSWPPLRGQTQCRKDLKGKNQLAPLQGEGLAGGMLRSGPWARRQRPAHLGGRRGGCSRQEVTHPAHVPVPGVGLPDPGWYLPYFTLSRALEG